MAINKNKLFDPNSLIINTDVSEIDNLLDYEDVLLSISKEIVNYRKVHHLTQKDLAELLDVDQTMISKLENGTYNPTFKNIHSMSVKLCNSSEFFIDVLKRIIEILYRAKDINTKFYVVTKSENNTNNHNNKYKYNYEGGMVYERFTRNSYISNVG